MKILVSTATLLFALFCLQSGKAQSNQEPAAPAKPDDGSIEAKVVAVNRGLGFLIVDAGTRKGVKKGMEVSILRDKKRIAGILKIGEIEEDATVLEYVPGKANAGDKIDRVIFSVPVKGKK